MKQQTNRTSTTARLRQSILAIILVTLSAFSATAQMDYTLKINKPSSSGYAPVNGLKMFYQIYGQGKPLLLIHGAYMSIDLNWGELIPELSKTHKVIAVEMQGHGRTADIDRIFTNEGLASDLAGLLKYLKIQKADVIGYSLGASVGLQLAINNTGLVDKLVFISSTFRHNGWSKELRELLKTMKPEYLEQTPLKKEYVRIAPDTTHFLEFARKLIAYEFIEYDMGASNIQQLGGPVLIISGDNDGVDLAHLAEMYKLLGGGVVGDAFPMPKSQLTIFPATSHVTLFMQPDKLLSVIKPFLASAEPIKQH